MNYIVKIGMLNPKPIDPEKQPKKATGFNFQGPYLHGQKQSCINFE